MKVIVLGGAGFVGRSIVGRLTQCSNMQPMVASRKPTTYSSAPTVSVDAMDPNQLRGVLKDADAVVNCITGDGRVIAESAEILSQAAAACQTRPRIVHMSTMSVYGTTEGLVDESTPVKADIGWYGEAKIRAEESLGAYARQGGSVFMLRIGCVYGPHSDLWTNRIGRLLRARRLGDLGEQGDGWSNLVHVDDIATATLACLEATHHGGGRFYNLAAPDSPRWNEYFRDFALAINATPLRYLTRLGIAWEGKVMAPPLKLAERVLKKARKDTSRLPDGMPPSLLRLWGQHIRLNSRAIEDDLNMRWTPYRDGLRSSVESFRGR